MISELKPYPAYKDSGVPWLGQVPEHWDVERLKNRASNIVEQTASAASDDLYVALEHVESWTGRIRSTNTNTAFESQVKKFKANDVLFGKLRPYLAKVARPTRRGVCVGEFFVLRTQSYKLQSAFLEHLLRAKPIIDIVDASTFGAKMPRADWQFVGNMALAYPSPTEQSVIVRFLDHADRRIRRYIAAKQKLIRLLNEQKQVIIHRAVTRGLDPNVRHMPSGVEWLGEVPEYWDVVRLGRLIQLTTGFPFKSEGFSQYPNDIRLLRGINITPGRVRWEAIVRWPANQCGDFSEYELREGDVVLGMDRPIISAGVRVAKISSEDVPSLVLQRVARIRPHSDLDAEFLLLLLGGKSFADYLAPIFTGISVPHISPEQIGSFRIALPDLAEQVQIVKWLKGNTAELDGSMGAAIREIDLLREYRACLIADVVTGKLDVREAATLPDETEEPELYEEADEVTEGEETIEDTDSETEDATV